MEPPAHELLDPSSMSSLPPPSSPESHIVASAPASLSLAILPSRPAPALPFSNQCTTVNECETSLLLAERTPYLHCNEDKTLLPEPDTPAPEVPDGMICNFSDPSYSPPPPPGTEENHTVATKSEYEILEPAPEPPTCTEQPVYQKWQAAISLRDEDGALALRDNLGEQTKQFLKTFDTSRTSILLPCHIPARWSVVKKVSVLCKKFGHFV